MRSIPLSGPHKEDGSGGKAWFEYSYVTLLGQKKILFLSYSFDVPNLLPISEQWEAVGGAKVGRVVQGCGKRGEGSL